MLDFIKESVNTDARMPPDDRPLLALARTMTATLLRNLLTFLDYVIRHQTTRGSVARVERLTGYRESVGIELKRFCNDVVSLLDRRLFEANTDVNDRVFYGVKGDMLRYRCEFAEDAERWEPADAANGGCATGARERALGAV